MQNLFKASIQINKYKSISHRFKSQIEEFNSKLWKISNTKARIAIQGDIKQITYQTAFFDNVHAKDLEIKFNLLAILMSDHMTKESCNFQKLQIQVDYLIFSVLLNLNSFNQLIQKEKIYQDSLYAQMAPLDEESQNKVLFQIQEIIQILFYWEKEVSSQLTKKSQFISNVIEDSKSPNLEKEESVIKLEIFNYDNENLYQKSQENAKPNFKLVNSPFKTLLQFIRDRIVSLGLCLVHFGNVNHLLFLFQEMLFSADSNNWAKQLIRFPNDSNLENLKLFTDTLAMVYRILENEDENKKSLEYNIQFNLIEFLNSLPLSKFTDFLDSNPFQDFVQFQNYVLKICKNFGNILQKLDPTIYELKIITQKFIDFSREISTSIFESNKFDISQKQELIDNIFLEINKSISQVPHLVCFLTPLPYHLVSLNSSWEIVNFLLRIVETTPNQKLNQLNENSNQLNENLNQINENSNQINENSNQLNQNSNENSNQLNENLNEKINQNSNEKINQNSNQINENSNQLNEKINQNSNQNSNEKINQNSNEKFLFNCSYDIGSPIIYLFGKIAKFQKNEQLSTFVLFFFWQIATSEHKQNQIYLKTILETTREILQYQPQNSGFILGQINNSAPNILSPEIIHSFMSTIPIELWSPLKKHFGIIKKWIEHPFETPQFAAVTQIIEKLNWGYSSDSLYINPKFHQMILFAISNRCIQLKKKEITNHPHFYQWCWKIVFQLKLFANNGQRYLEPLDFFQFQNKITKKMSSLTSYTILVSTNFIDVLETHLKERAKNSKNDFETLCNRLFQSFIKEKTTFQLFKALYLLIKNSLYKISLQKLDEEQNSFEYCLKLVDNVQFLYRDYFQKTISLEIVPTEYTEIPFFPAELFISDFIYTMLDSSIEPNSQPKENQPITNQNTYAINCSTEFNKIILFWLSLFTSFQDWSRNPIIVHCLNKLARISFVFDCYQLIEMFFIQKLKDHSLNNTPQNPFGIIGCYPFFVRKNWNQKDRLKLIHNSPYILFTILMAETKHELQNRKIIGKQILEKKPKEIAKFIKSKLIYPHLNHVFWWVDFLRFHKYNHPLSSLIWQVFFALYFESVDSQSFYQMIQNSKNSDSTLDSESNENISISSDQRRNLASKNGLFGLELLMLYPDTKHNLFDELTFRLDELSKNLKSDFGMLFSSMKYWIQKDVQTLFSQAHTKNKEMHDQYFFSKLISFVTTELFDKKSNHLWFDLFHKPTFVDHSSLKTEYRKIFASFFGDEKNADKTTSSNTDKHTPHSLRNHHKDGLDSFSKSSESILDNSENGNGNVAKNEPNEIPNYDQKYILSWFKTVFDKIIKFETNFEIIDDINDDFNKYFDLLVSKSTSFQDKLKYHKKMDIFFFNFISKIFTNEQEKHIFTFTFPDILEIREESLLFVFPTFKKNAQMIEALNKNRSLASKHLAKYPLISKEVPFSIFFLEKAFEILSRFLETCQQQEQKRKIQFIHIKWTNRIMFQLCNGYSILFPPIYNFAINNFENVILVFLNLYSEFCLSGKYELIQNENKYQISSSEMDLTLHLVFKLIFSRFPKKPYPKKLAELIHLQNVLKNYLQAQFPNFYVNLLRFALKNFLEDEKELSNTWEFLLALPITSKLSLDEIISTIRFLNEKMVSFTQILFIENDHTHSEEKQFESFQLFSVFPEVLLKYLIKLFNLLANCDCISQLKSPSRSILEPQQNIQMDPKISFHYFIFKTLYLPFLEVFHFLENITISDEIMENVCEQFQKCVDSTNFAHDYKQFVMDFDKFPNGNISQSFSQSLAKYVDWSKIVVDEQLIQNFAESINGNNALIAISSFDKFDWKVYLSTKSLKLSESRLKLIISVLWNVFYYESEEERTQIINFFCKNISVEKEIEENTYNSIIDFANHLIFSINPIKSEKKENKIIVDMAEQKQKIREAIPINDITESIETMNSSEFKIVLVVLFSKMIGNFAKTKDPKKSEIYMNFLYNILKVAIISQQSRIKRNYRGSPQNTKDLQQFINSFLMYCDQEDLKKLVDIQEQETNLSLKIISENLVVFLFSEIVEVLSEINYTTDSILRLIDLFNISRTKIREILMKLFFQKTNKLIFIAEFMKNIIQKIHSKDFLYLLLEIFSFRILSNSTEINTIISVIQGLQFDNQACIKFGNFNLLILSFLMKEREVELTENFNVESFRNMNNNFFDLIFQSSFPQYREKSIVMFLYLYFYNISSILEQYGNYERINTEDFSQKIFSISQLCLKYSQNKISIPWLDQTIHEMNYRLPKLFVIVFDILHTYIHNQFLIKFSQKENEEEKENPISIKEYFQQQDESNHLIEEIEKLQNYSVSNLQEFTKNILQLLKLLNQILFLENHDYFSNFEVIENVKPKFTNQN